MYLPSNLSIQLLDDEEKSNPGLLFPGMERANTVPVGGTNGTGRDYSRSCESRKLTIPHAQNQAFSLDVHVPAREVLCKRNFFDAPLTSIYSSEYSRDKFNAISRKIMEMGFSSDEALAGIVITDALGIREAVNAITVLQPIPGKHQYVARRCYTGDDAKARHNLLNQFGDDSSYDRWPWNVPNENLCALCGLPQQLFHQGQHDLLDIFGEPWSKIRMSRDAVQRTFNSTDIVNIAVGDYSILSGREPTDETIDAQLERKIMESKDTITCGICWDDLPREEFLSAPCGHHYCSGCLKMHYRTKIMQGDVLRVPCPYLDDNNFPCDREIEEEEILYFCDDEMKAKFQRFKECRLIQLNDKARFCPKAGCDGWAIGSKWKPKLTCLECGYIYCWKCTNNWHGYFSRCVNPHDGLFLLFTLGKDIQKCPKCKVRIWKNDGCNHMTCKYCNYEFCWLCRGRYTNNHFEPWNIFGCPGALYFDWLRCPSCCPRFVNRLFIILFLLSLALPLAITFGCAVGVMLLAFCIIWLALWLATCTCGVCITEDYWSPCGCRDYWCD